MSRFRDNLRRDLIDVKAAYLSKPIRAVAIAVSPFSIMQAPGFLSGVLFCFVLVMIGDVLTEAKNATASEPRT